MKYADFFADTGIVNGRVLQAVPQCFVVQQNFRTRSNQRRRSQVPIVNPIILLHASSSHHSINCTRNLRNTKIRSAAAQLPLFSRERQCTVNSRIYKSIRKASSCSTEIMHSPCGGTVGPDFDLSFNS